MNSLTNDNHEFSADVIIIGAGISGLFAAKTLDENKVGKILILEAKDRIGGKVYSETIDIGERGKLRLDVGGAFVGKEQKRLLQLAKELNVKTSNTYNDGKNILYLCGKKKIYNGDYPFYDLSSLLDTNKLLCKLDHLMEKLNQKKFSEVEIEKMDKTSVWEWVEENGETDIAKSMISASISTAFGDLKNYSLYSCLKDCASCGGLLQVLEVENGAQEMLFVEGSYSLCERMSKNFSERVKINLNMKVNSINYKNNKKIVLSCEKDNQKTEYFCTKLIVCISPLQFVDLHFSPPLPSNKISKETKLTGFNYFKSFFIYERRWWVEKGLSAQLFSDDGPVWWSVDGMVDDENNKKYGVLIGFVSEKWQNCDQEKRKKEIIKQYKEMFETDEVENYIAYHEKDWKEENSGFCGGNFPLNSSRFYYHHMSTTVDNLIFFGGSEVSAKWSG
eukprot:TRINITY_DN17681_c0_g1_i1.p1 TRINITY_DN17681_c0_g1~~TRINITY_DN17681_c0_g1_i1.p1  ORF type:complete len:447 (+),score=137.02 TRINITY_DN17681_c0_g1_i1:3-1343(+)